MKNKDRNDEELTKRLTGKKVNSPANDGVYRSEMEQLRRLCPQNKRTYIYINK